MATIVYRTNGAWGPGQGSNLSPAQVDENFFNLESAITSLQDHALTTENQIDFFSVSGNQLFVTMMNNQVFGPYLIPTAQWRYRGAWQPNTVYDSMDVITEGGALYLVTNGPFTSAGTFNAGANNGEGGDFYNLILDSPPDTLPSGGTAGQVLTIGTSPADLTWVSPTRNIGTFIDGSPEPNQRIFQYVVPEEMTLPAGLEGSVAFVVAEPTGDQFYELFQNGSSIGSIVFTPTNISFSFSVAVTFSPGDVLSLVAPSSIDPHMLDISITLVATLP